MFHLRKMFTFFIFISGINFYFSYLVNQENLDDEFKLGLENISEKLLQKLLTQKNDRLPRIGLITNQTGVDQYGRRNIDIFISKGLNIKAIFAPEHGIDGKIEAEKFIKDSKDKITGLPIHSLYLGDSRFKKFEKKDLDDIDVLIFDIQDSGMRHYTYISILYKMLEVAAQFNKKIIVLDRPNPLGHLMEGPLVEKDLISFVSISSIPLRHAMTVGELALYFNKFNLSKPANLTVVPMKGYRRTRGLNGKLEKFLSPNIQNINACYNYSFLGILGEISPFAILHNTEHAFQCLMIPDIKINSKINWLKLTKLLNDNAIEAVPFKYVKDGKKLIGLKINVKDINKINSFKTILDILDFFKKEGFKFHYSRNFNKIVGSAEFKSLIDGKKDRLHFYNQINTGLKEFYNKVKNLFIYFPVPKIIEIK